MSLHDVHVAPAGDVPTREELVALYRICYLQDILVAPDAQRAGIGARLVGEVLRRYPAVRQKVLLTDDDPRQRAFYESLSYTEIRDFARAPLRALVRVDN